MTVIDPPEQPMVDLPPIVMALGELTTCLCELLASEGAGPTCWCGLWPGAAPSWEYCGECSGGNCGMGYVRMAGIFPYATFPIPLIDDRCVKPLAWAIEVGALRCFPVHGDGEVATPNELADVTIGQMLDAQAMYKAIKCCGIEVAVQEYRPVGPEGGCVGGLWLAFIAVN